MQVSFHEVIFEIVHHEAYLVSSLLACDISQSVCCECVPMKDMRCRKAMSGLENPSSRHGSFCN